MNNAILLLSGGLDSGVLAYYLKDKCKKIKPLFFDYGQRSLKEEEYCSKEISKRIKAEFIKVDLKWLGNISTAFLNKNESFPETKENELGDLEKNKEDILNWWVPCRNSIFIINALAFAESEFLKNKERYDVYIGLKNEGHVHMKDTTPKFIDIMNKVAEEGTNDGGYKVIAPFIEYDKTEVINLGDKLKVPFELTYSCYIGSKDRLRHCGKCLNCVLRKKGFYWGGIKDNILYGD